METKLVWIMGALITGLLAVFLIVSKYYNFDDILAYFSASEESEEEKKRQAVAGSF